MIRNPILIRKTKPKNYCLVFLDEDVVCGVSPANDFTLETADIG